MARLHSRAEGRAGRDDRGKRTVVPGEVHVPPGRAPDGWVPEARREDGGVHRDAGDVGPERIEVEAEDRVEVAPVATQELLLRRAEERSRPVVEVRDEVDAGVPRPPDGRVERGEEKNAARGVPWRGEIHPVEVR